jgi:xanthine dehydrogenase YagS FAD-binding subunit
VRPLTYSRAAGIDHALVLVGTSPASAFLAGGTTEVDLIRAGVSQTEHLVDINDLPLAGVEDRDDGGVHIGALARMSDVARTPSVVQRYPAISQALLLSASEQLRNMASMAGNLLQRTRCPYLRDGVSPCNKRDPGSGCAALDGIRTLGPGGARSLRIDDFFLLPGGTPEVEHPLAHGELIVGIEVPGARSARRSVYLKVRDRQSYEFALVSVAAALAVDDGVVTDVRLALGGVGTKPWRARRAEAALLGGRADEASFRQAAAAELAGAVVRRHNAFKVELAQRAMVRALVHNQEGRQP